MHIRPSLRYTIFPPEPVPGTCRIFTPALKPTSQHILDHALKLFNEKGFVNVRLQHVADRAFVSIGHLAYHFRNKDALVGSLCDRLQAMQEELMNEFRTVPLFEDIDRYVQSLYHLQHHYIFFYQDMLEVFRAYPHIAGKYQHHLLWRQNQLGMMIDFNIARGSFTAIVPDQRVALIRQISSLAETWVYITQTQHYTPDSLQDFALAFWSLLQPYFTDMGQREFEQLPSRLTT